MIINTGEWEQDAKFRALLLQMLRNSCWKAPLSAKRQNRDSHGDSGEKVEKGTTKNERNFIFI